MLGENIKILRKNKGLTQEELATRLRVVRQTISKWEKGLSVPDAELLQRLAEELEVSVPQLLGAPVELNGQDGDAVTTAQLAEQLARINEQLVIKNRRSRKIWRIVGIVLISVVVINLLMILLSMAAFETYTYETDASVSAETRIVEP